MFERSSVTQFKPYLMQMTFTFARVFDDLFRYKNLARAFDPSVILRRVIKRLPGLDYITRSHFDAVDYPQYAYGVLMACLQARALGHDRVTVIEFGVASGNGLLALGHAGRQIGGKLGVEVTAVGFDTGEGLPMEEDYRDLPYWYGRGDYKMDVAALRARLGGNCRLVLGNIAETVPNYLAAAGGDGPIGFCSFDVDYYSSTRDALKIFGGTAATRLPRVLCYFDDINVGDLAYVTPRIGQVAAISEFNAGHPDTELAKVGAVRHNRPIEASWNDVIYVFQDFTHPNFNTHLEFGDRQIALR